MTKVKISKNLTTKAVLVEGKPIYLSSFTQREVEVLAIYGLKQYLMDRLLGVKPENIFEAVQSALTKLGKNKQ